MKSLPVITSVSVACQIPSSLSTTQAGLNDNHRKDDTRETNATLTQQLIIRMNWIVGSNIRYHHLKECIAGRHYKQHMKVANWAEKALQASANGNQR